MTGNLGTMDFCSCELSQFIHLYGKALTRSENDKRWIAIGKMENAFLELTFVQRAKLWGVVSALICGLGLSDIALGVETRGAKAAKQPSYRHYSNEKYTYSVNYPSYLVPGGESDAQDGQCFSSSSKSLKMKVWGCYSNWMNGDEMTLAEQRDWMLAHLAGDDLPAPKVTYRAQGNNWFVISGTSSGNVFYQRTIKEGDSFATVLITYPSAQKAEFDSVVVCIARSLKG